MIRLYHVGVLFTMDENGNELGKDCRWAKSFHI